MLVVSTTENICL